MAPLPILWGNPMKTILFLLVFLASTAFGQVGSETPYWKWSKPADHHKAVIRITSGGGYGTGVLIKDAGKVVIVTASHVIEGSNDHTAILSNSSEKLFVIATSETNDVACLGFSRSGVVLSSENTPTTVGIVNLYVKNPLEVCGYGGSDITRHPMRHFWARNTIASSSGILYLDGMAIPGDSGGGIFHEGRLVGIVSGGHTWLGHRTVKVKRGSRDFRVSCTWPIRAAGPKSIWAVVQPQPVQLVTPSLSN